MKIGSRTAIMSAYFMVIGDNFWDAVAGEGTWEWFVNKAVAATVVLAFFIFMDLIKVFRYDN